MKVGLLWYDDDRKRSLTDKITRAAKRYRQKYGTPPTTCYVHPSALPENSNTTQAGTVHVATLPTVLEHHFWLGQEDQP